MIQLNRASAQYLTSPPPDWSGGSYTICGWIKVDSGLGNYQGVNVCTLVKHIGKDFDTLTVVRNTTDSSWRLGLVCQTSWSQAYGSSSYETIDLTDKPLFYVLMRTGEDLIARIYEDGANTYIADTLTQSGSTRSSTPDAAVFGASANGSVYTADTDMQTGGVRFWDRLLTDSELLAERWQLSHRNAEALSGSYPMVEGHDRDFDYSGQGGTLTEFGSPSAGTASPPVSWGGSGPSWQSEAAAPSGVTVTPGAASLTLTGNAPTATASDLITVEPTTAALTLATAAPTVTATDAQEVTPSTAALTLTGQAPTVTVGDNIAVEPSTAALTLATAAPDVTATANVSVEPTTATLTLATFTPLVTAGDAQVVEPTTATLTLATFAPSVTAVADVVATPGVASLSLTGYAPTVTGVANVTATPGVASLTLTGYAPTLTAPEDVTATPINTDLVLTGYAPLIRISARVAVVTSGAFSVAADFAPGDEWFCILDGPSADSPAARVEVIFKKDV